MITLITKCPQCGKENEIHVNEHDYENYKNGDLVQNAFPYLSLAEREMLISGVCPTCWKSIFDITKTK